MYILEDHENSNSIVRSLALTQVVPKAQKERNFPFRVSEGDDGELGTRKWESYLRVGWVLFEVERDLPCTPPNQHLVMINPGY
jgi:hypothetical protein